MKRTELASLYYKDVSVVRRADCGKDGFGSGKSREDVRSPDIGCRAAKRGAWTSIIEPMIITLHAPASTEVSCSDCIEMWLLWKGAKTGPTNTNSPQCWRCCSMHHYNSALACQLVKIGPLAAQPSDTNNGSEQSNLFYEPGCRA